MIFAIHLRECMSINTDPSVIYIYDFLLGVREYNFYFSHTYYIFYFIHCFRHSVFIIMEGIVKLKMFDVEKNAVSYESSITKNTVRAAFRLAGNAFVALSYKVGEIEVVCG